MTDELENLRPEVREAVQELDGKAYPGSRTHEHWLTIRAELLRLAGVEAELAALKARIAEAPVSIVGRCALNSSPEYNIVTSCSPLDGKRVALVVLGEGE